MLLCFSRIANIFLNIEKCWALTNQSKKNLMEKIHQIIALIPAGTLVISLLLNFICIITLQKRTIRTTLRLYILSSFLIIAACVTGGMIMQSVPEISGNQRDLFILHAWTSALVFIFSLVIAILSITSLKRLKRGQVIHGKRLGMILFLGLITVTFTVWSIISAHEFVTSQIQIPAL